MTDLERLIGLARIARVVFERVAKKDGWKDTLGGFCYDASSFLRRMAMAYGIETELGMGDCHWFVLYGNIVVDITSTQFGHPDRVAVLSLNEAEKLGSWWQLQGRHSDPPRLSYGGVEKTADIVIEEMVGLGVGEAEL